MEMEPRTLASTSQVSPEQHTAHGYGSSSATGTYAKKTMSANHNHVRFSPGTSPAPPPGPEHPKSPDLKWALVLEAAHGVSSLRLVRQTCVSAAGGS